MGFPPFGGFGVEKVHERSISMPPLDGFAVVEEVAFVFGFLVIGTVVVDDRGGPEHDFDVVGVEIVDETLGVGEEGLIPDEIIVAGGPAGVYVESSEGNLVFHVGLCHFHDGLLVLGVIVPDDMAVGPVGIGRLLISTITGYDDAEYDE